MRKYIELEIDGVTVALPLEELPFLLSYRIANELGQAAGSSADRFIDIPGSKETNNLYQTYSDISTNNKTAIELKETTVKVNGVPVFEGVSQLQRAILNGKGRPYKREVSKYKVGLYGSNASWLLALKGLKLSDLTFTNQTFDSATVQAGWGASYDGGDFFGFCLIKWRTWNNETGGTTLKSSVSVDLSEFTPFLFIRSILEAIENEIGYTFNSKLLSTERFKSLILPIAPVETYPQTYSDDFLNFILEVPNVTITAQPTSPPPTAVVLLGLNALQLPSLNPGAWVGATSTYTVLSDGFLIFETDLTCTATSATPPQYCFIGVSISGAPFQPLAQFGSVALGGPAIAAGERSRFKSLVIPILAGDTIQIQSFCVEQVGPTPQTCDIQGTIQATFEASFGFNQPIVWEYLLKDWTALDFINGLTDVHNLRFETDEATKTISFEPRNNYTDTTATTAATLEDGFFDDSTTTDYTSKLDFQKDAEIERLKPKRNQVFKWATDGATESAKEEGQLRGIYEGAYILQDNTFLDQDETKEVRFFAKTIHTLEQIIQSDPDTVGTDIAPLIPLIFPQDYQKDDQALSANYDVKPRLLHFFGQRGGIDGYLQVDTVGDIETPACFFVNYNDNTGNDPSLSFANETINGLSVPGLLDTYYIHEMATLSNAKRLKEFLLWNTLMLNNLSFQNTFFLDNIRYIIEEIQDFDPTQDNSTKTILLPYILATVADSNNIENSLLNGLAVLFP